MKGSKKEKKKETKPAEKPKKKSLLSKLLDSGATKKEILHRRDTEKAMGLKRGPGAWSGRHNDPRKKAAKKTKKK